MLMAGPDSSYTPIMTTVVVFTLSRSFYPTSAVPPVSFLIHPREMQNYVVTHSETGKTKRKIIKVGKSCASVPGTKAQQKKRHPSKKRYEKKMLDE